MPIRWRPNDGRERDREREREREREMGRVSEGDRQIGWREKKREGERDGRWRRSRIYVPWEPQGKARAFGKNKQGDRTLFPLICTSREQRLNFS